MYTKRKYNKKRSRKNQRTRKRGGFFSSFLKKNNMVPREAIYINKDKSILRDLEYARKKSLFKVFANKNELKLAVESYTSNNQNNKKQITDKYGQINKWDVSKINDFSRIFYDKNNFNEDISNWNVSMAINMSEMFSGATSFNQPLNKWDVSNVTNMSQMFRDARSFNQPLDEWNVGNVKTMENMFNGASSFNQQLNTWNVRNVTNMLGTFSQAINFNQPLDNWNVNNVTIMAYMFYGATNFDQLLDNWNVNSLRKAYNNSSRTQRTQLVNIFTNSGMKKLPTWYLIITGQVPKPIIERKQTKIKFRDEDVVRDNGGLVRKAIYSTYDEPIRVPYVGDIYNTKNGYGG